MLIKGGWLLCDDGVTRPVIECEILAADGCSWVPTEFLVDTGADRTVLAERALTASALPHLPAAQQLGGVGGVSNTVAIGTDIRFRIGDGGSLTIQGTFAAFTHPAALEMSVLGRDITNLFAVMIDKPADIVCLIGKGHRYSIAKDP